MDGQVDDATLAAIQRYYDFAFITGVEPLPTPALLRELRGVADQVASLRADTAAQAENDAAAAQDWLDQEADGGSTTDQAEQPGELRYGSEAAVAGGSEIPGLGEPAIPNLAPADEVVPVERLLEPAIPEAAPIETAAGAFSSEEEAPAAEESLGEDAATLPEEPPVEAAAPTAEPDSDLAGAESATDSVLEVEQQPEPEDVQVAASESGSAPEEPVEDLQIEEAAPEPVADAPREQLATLETASPAVPEAEEAASAVADQGPQDAVALEAAAVETASAEELQGEEVAESLAGAPLAEAEPVIEAVPDVTQEAAAPVETDGTSQEAASNPSPAAANDGQQDNASEQLARLPAASASPAPAFNESPSALYSRGMDLYRLGDYQSAIAFFSDVLRRDPGFAAAYQLRGASYEAIGQLALALKDFDTLIELTPSSAAAYNNRCWVLARSQRFAEALADCNQALSLNPYDSEALHSRGYVHEKLGQHERARLDYTRAYQLNPYDSDIAADARRIGLVQ